MTRFKITLLFVIIAALCAGCGSTDKRYHEEPPVYHHISGDWLFLDGVEMKLEDLRWVGRTLPDLKINDLFAYKGMNVSSNTATFNVLISVEDIGVLQIYAGSDYEITSMTFKAREAENPLNLLTEAEKLDEYIDGVYIPIAHNIV